MRPSDAPAASTPFTAIIKSPTTIGWSATFEPLKAEVPAAYPWLEFGHVPDSPDSKRIVQDWVRLDEPDPHFRELLPVGFVRSLVLTSANSDLLVGAQLRAAVSTDPLHSMVTRARLRRGDAHPVFGAKALSVVFPDVGALSWPDIDDLRRHPDIRYLRDVLVDVEAEACQPANSLDDLEQRIHAAYLERLREAQHRAEGSFRGKLVVAIVSLVAGEIAGSAVGGLGAGFLLSLGAGGLAELGVDYAAGKVYSALTRPKWLTADAALSRRIRDRRDVRER